MVPSPRSSLLAPSSSLLAPSSPAPQRSRRQSQQSQRIIDIDRRPAFPPEILDRFPLFQSSISDLPSPRKWPFCRRFRF